MTSPLLAIALMVLSVACAEKPKAVEAKPPKAPKTAISQGEVAQKVRALKAPAVRQVEAHVVDPARVAIEEDFLEDAAQRITKRSNLDAEIERLAAEINGTARASTP